MKQELATDSNGQVDVKGIIFTTIGDVSPEFRLQNLTKISQCSPNSTAIITKIAGYLRIRTLMDR